MLSADKPPKTSEEYSIFKNEPEIILPVQQGRATTPLTNRYKLITKPLTPTHRQATKLANDAAKISTSKPTKQ